MAAHAESKFHFSHQTHKMSLVHFRRRGDGGDRELSAGSSIAQNWVVVVIIESIKLDCSPYGIWRSYK